MSETYKCFVCAETGTMLSTDALYYCEAPARRMEQALQSDTSAARLARRKKDSFRISPDLMKALMKQDVEAVGRLMGWTVGQTVEGQVLLYTGKKAKK